jgi:nucleoside-diphosphate-sugar epimerase
MSKPTVLLTGATGFLGSHLLEALLKNGHKIVILKRSTSDVWRIKDHMDQVVSYDVDIQGIELAFEQQRIDVVMHTACHYGRNGDSITQVVESNLMFGLRILDACLKYNTGTFFNTDSLLPRDLNTYSLSKKQFVEYLKQQSSKIKMINLKLEHMYGPKDDATKFVSWVLSQLKANVKKIKLTEGEQLRDFIYIDDVVSAYLTTLEKTSGLIGFNEFDVGTGQFVSVRSFLEQLKEIYEIKLGTTSTRFEFGAIPYREGEMMSVELNNQPLRALGWQPKMNLTAGIEKVVKERL